MLHEFITSNRLELIRRCQDKVAERFGSPGLRANTERGVPIFLQQLVDILCAEQSTPIRPSPEPERTPATWTLGRAATFHGVELLRLGFTVDQVVHEYGDVCQSITQLAVETHTEISADEFCTLNRCLDDAIADAVSSFVRGRHGAAKVQIDNLRASLEVFLDEQARLIETATQAFSAIKTGGVGTGGATGQLLAHTLTELRYLTERTLPKIHLAFDRAFPTNQTSLPASIGSPAETVGATRTVALPRDNL